mgnify:CR=1 FL=1
MAEEKGTWNIVERIDNQRSKKRYDWKLEGKVNGWNQEKRRKGFDYVWVGKKKKDWRWTKKSRKAIDGRIKKIAKADSIRD